MKSVNDIKVKKILRVLFLFHLNSRKLNDKTYNAIYDYMDENQNKISGYGYGHIPGHRIYRIYLKDGSYMDWEVKKR